MELSTLRLCLILGAKKLANSSWLIIIFLELGCKENYLEKKYFVRQITLDLSKLYFIKCCIQCGDKISRVPNVLWTNGFWSKDVEPPTLHLHVIPRAKKIGKLLLINNYFFRIRMKDN